MNDELEQAKYEFMKHVYAIFEDMANTFAVYATTAALLTQVKKGRSKKYIHEMYNDMVVIFNMPILSQQIFGKAITMKDIMERLEREYDIDFKRIHVHIESENVNSPLEQF